MDAKTFRVPMARVWREACDYTAREREKKGSGVICICGERVRLALVPNRIDVTECGKARV